MEALLFWIAVYGVLAYVAWYVYACFARYWLRLPPGPPPLPIIGNLHQLSTTNLRHQAFAALAKIYGPIMYLRLGSRSLVIISSAAVAKEIVGTQDVAFSSRPRLEAGQMFYDHLNIGFMPYDSTWRLMRRIFAVQLLSQKKIESYKSIRNEEMDRMLNRIHEASRRREPINVRDVVSVMAASTMTRIVLSKDYSGPELSMMIEEVFKLSGTPVLSDFLPFLRWLDVGGFIKRMKNVHRSFDRFLDSVLQERRQLRSKQSCEAGEEDFLDSLLSASGDENLSDEAIKASILESLGAGVDPTSVPSEWAMAEMIRQPAILKKLQEEIDSEVGRSRQVMLTDILNLPYLHAVSKETFRLHPTAALLLPRYNMKQCQVAGYTIPQKTDVSLNVWAIGRDEAAWERALDFWPERFVGSEIDLKGKHSQLLPFGGGRRACPGLPLGLSLFHHTLSNLIHCFNWSIATRETPGTLDMTEEQGVNIHRAKPLLLYATPRLQLHKFCCI